MFAVVEGKMTAVAVGGFGNKAEEEMGGIAFGLACPAVSPTNSMRTRREEGRSNSLSILMMMMVASLLITFRLRLLVWYSGVLFAKGEGV